MCVCLFFLWKAIQECDNPGQLLHGMEAQHLVLRTRLQPKEFTGIGLLLDNCKNLEKLTIDIVPSPPSLFPVKITIHGIVVGIGSHF